VTDDDRQHLRTIIDQHNTIAEKFRTSSEAFDRAMEGLGTTMREVHTANRAQLEALDALIAANQAALRLFNRGEAGDR
jgi:hypothetical protein